MVIFHVRKYIAGKDGLSVIGSDGKAIMGSFPVMVDTDVYELIKNFDWCVREKTLYAYTSLPPFASIEYGKKTILLHRMITNAPDDLVVHHINGDRLDNRRSNLQILTRAEHGKTHSAEDRAHTEYIMRKARRARTFYRQSAARP